MYLFFYLVYFFFCIVDNILSLPHPSCSALQNSISQILERLYLKQYRIKATVSVPELNGMNVDSILPLSISYLLLRSLEVDNTSTNEGVSGSSNATGGGKKSDILRLYAMRSGLTAFDYDDESSDTIKQLLIRCMMHPLFIRTIEGRKFLSFIFVSIGTTGSNGMGSSFEMIRMFHDCIKSQLLECKQSFLELYGDIYIRAWKLCCNNETNGGANTTNKNDKFLLNSVGTTQRLLFFEHEIVQDLMQRAIYSAHTKTSIVIMKVLEFSFHNIKIKIKEKKIEEMLQRLYEPILWRSLKMENNIVKRNAAEVFLNVFPLVLHNTEGKNGNSSSSNSSTSSSFSSNEEFLQYQFQALFDLLDENDLGIRIIGVSGISRILTRLVNKQE